MPGPSGLDVQHLLVSAGPPTSRSSSSPGTVTSRMAVQAMKAGAIDFLVKPFDDLIFLNAVQRAIAKSRQRRA